MKITGGRLVDLFRTRGIEITLSDADIDKFLRFEDSYKSQFYPLL